MKGSLVGHTRSSSPGCAAAPLPGCAAASQVGRRGLKLHVSDQPLPEHRGPEGAQAWDCREPIALVKKLSGQRLQFDSVSREALTHSARALGDGNTGAGSGACRRFPGCCSQFLEFASGETPAEGAHLAGQGPGSTWGSRSPWESRVGAPDSHRPPVGAHTLFFTSFPQARPRRPHSPGLTPHPAPSTLGGQISAAVATHRRGHVQTPGRRAW